MKRKWLRTAAAVLSVATAATWLQAADPGVLRITAYINIASGCQTPTEQFLKDLAATYRGRVSLEFVDFGTPAGRARWTADGRHCMAIALNGSSHASIVHKGAELDVTFEMPVGHNWLHEELATAVRQKLDGISAADRRGPEITVRATPVPAAVVVDDQVVVELADAAAAEQLAGVLGEAAKAKPLVQDDFALDIAEGSAKVSLRGIPLLDLGRVGVPAPEGAEARAEQAFLRLVRPFPRVSRPFPGQTATPMRR